MLNVLRVPINAIKEPSFLRVEYGSKCHCTCGRELLLNLYYILLYFNFHL